MFIIMRILRRRYMHMDIIYCIHARGEVHGLQVDVRLGAWRGVLLRKKKYER